MSKSMMLSTQSMDGLKRNLHIPIILSYLALSIVLISVGVHGYHIYLKCDYIQKASKKFWSTPVGYVPSEFAWLFVGTYLIPTGIALFMVFMVQFEKSAVNNYFKLLILYGLLGLSLWCIYQSYLLSFEVLDCGVFCVGDVKLAPKLVKNGEAFVGMIYFFTSIAGCFLVFGSILYTHYKMIWNRKSSQQTVTNDPNVHSSSSNDTETAAVSSVEHKVIPKPPSYLGRNLLAMFLAFIVLFPFFLIACTALPASWKGFTVAKIRTYQFALPPKNATAYWMVEYGRFIKFKLYPDILYYYLSMYLVLFVAGLSYCFSFVKKFLHSRIIRYTTWTYGEAFLTLLAIGMLTGEYCFQYYKDKGNKTEEEWIALAFGHVGNMCMGMLALPIAKNSIWSILFGVSWESILRFHQFLGYSFMGLGFIHCFYFWKVYDLAGAFPHDILALPTVVHGNNPSTQMMFITMLGALVFMVAFSLPIVRRKNYTLFYIAHHFAMIMFLAMLWHATSVWYYITASLVLWSADYAVRLYKCIGTETEVKSLQVSGNDDVVVLTYATNKLNRPVYKSCNTTAMSKMTASVCEKLSMTAPNSARENLPVNNEVAMESDVEDKIEHFYHHVGAYCFINVPAISTLEWHPFTISSLPYDSYITHHIKSRGVNEWTGKLLQLARESNKQGTDSDGIISKADTIDSGRSVESNDQQVLHTQSSLHTMNASTSIPTPVNIIVEGPYGAPMLDQPYSHILLIAGGIGITPLQAWYRDYYYRSMAVRNDMSKSGAEKDIAVLQKMELIWIVKHVDDLKTFATKLIMDSIPEIFSLSVYITQDGFTTTTTPTTDSTDKEMDLTITVPELSKLHQSYAFPIYYGRPSTLLKEKIESLVEYGNNAAVAVCGPQSLIKECSHMTSTRNKFISEVFTF